MTAPCCKQRIEIHTDPKNAQYVVKEGGRQKVCLFARNSFLTSADISFGVGWRGWPRSSSSCLFCFRKQEIIKMK